MHSVAYRSRILGKWISLVAGTLVSVSICFGQNVGGKVSGRITDQAGAIIQGANLSARDINTGVLSAGRSDTSGYYVFELPIGVYSITATSKGFSTSTQQNVTVTVGGDIGVNFQLRIGSTQTVVDVNGGSTPLINPDSAMVQTTVTNDLVSTIPIQVSSSIRNADEFLQLEPGYNGSSLNGGAGNEQSVTVDGVDVTPAGFNTGQETATSTMPVPAFAVQEFQVIGSNGGADTGRTSTGNVKYSLKSGTNQFHGDVFEFNRTTNYDAKTYFETVPGADHQNEFGGELGGPIQHNKTFFYGYYDGFRYSTANTAAIYSVLTQAMRAGNFSAAGIPAIYDPSTTSSNGSGGYTRTQFDCNGILNTICPSGFSKVSTFFAALMPLPNYGSASAIVNNYIGTTVSTIDSNQYLIKINHTFSPTNYIAVSYNYFEGPNNKTCPFGAFICGESETLYNYHGYRPIVNWEKAFSNTKFNHLILGFNLLGFLEDEGGQSSLTSGSNYSATAGLTGVNESGAPAISAGGYTIEGGANLNQITHSDAQLGDDFSWTHGTHEMQFGMEYQYFATIGIQGSEYPGTNWGSATFATQETSFPGKSTTGFAPASFLLGDVDSASLGTDPAQAMIQPYWAAYAQDAWKIRPNLTLTYGLRWEYCVPVHDRDDRLANFDPTLANPGAGNIPGALTFAGTIPGADGANQFAIPWHKGFGPRLGIAYAFRPGTVFRAAYSLQFNDSDQQAVHLNQQGYFGQATISSTNSGITPTFQWDNGFFYVPTVPSLISTTGNGLATTWEPPYADKEQMVENYNIGIQQRFWGRVVLDASYVGTQSHHMYDGSLDINQLNPSYLSLGNTLTANVGSAAANAAGIVSPYPGFTGTVAQALRPYPQYLNITNLQSANGDETYNSLQLRLQKTLSHGISFLSSYTIAKNITDVNGTQNYYNFAKDARAIAGGDIPQVFLVAYTYDLPFGQGALSFHNKVANGIIGGWTTSGVASFKKGTPLVVSNSGLSLPDIGTARPNVVPGVSPYLPNDTRARFNPRTDLYVNAAAFAAPPAFSFGDERAELSNLRSFGSKDWDAAVMKKIPIHENVKLTFEAEFFNVLNITNFSAPSTSITSAAFGTITGSGAARNGQMSLTLAF